MDQAAVGQPRLEQSDEMARALAEIVNSSQDAVIAKNVDGVITSWNPGATAVYGHAADDMIGRSFEKMVPRHELDAERARHARVAGGSAESGFRCFRLRLDGMPVEVVMSMSPVRDRDGHITGVASISRPVSSKERDAARFASLLEAAPDAILCVDTHGVIATVNAKGSAMFGYAREELLGQAIELLLPETARARHVLHRSAFLRDPRSRSMGVGLSLSGRRRDGSLFPVEISLALDNTGAQSFVIACARDMTEQRLVERGARENETRLRQLAESLDTVFILRQLDPPAYLYVSPGSRTVMGIDPEKLMATPDLARLALHPDDRARVEQDYLSVALLGQAADSQHRIVTPHGQTRWVHVRSMPVPNPHGPTERSVVTVADVTARVDAEATLREAERAARTANEAKNHFLSQMSHELRTPLNAVLGFGQILEFELEGTPHIEAVGQILKGGRHLLNLINDVLDVARIEAGEMSVSSEPVPVARLISESLRLMAPLAEAAGVSLMDTIATADWHVMADRQRMRQTLLNLLSNAIKYNRTGGKVWVEQRLVKDRVAISVHDDGPGISKALQVRLFTAFDRLGAEASGVDGTGIGLALTRSLAELMGGSLTVDSAPGRGSVFTITLPRTDPVSESSLAGIEATAAGTSVVDDPLLPTSTLLYIEDNTPNVHVIEHLLRLRPRWQLVHAGLGGLGLEIARASKPDLVFLDLHLPDGSGVDILSALKTHPGTRDIPVVILTADAAAGLSRQLLASGAEQYLTKPLNLHDVIGVLDRFERVEHAPDAA